MHEPKRSPDLESHDLFGSREDFTGRKLSFLACHGLHYGYGKEQSESLQAGTSSPPDNVIINQSKNGRSHGMHAVSPSASPTATFSALATGHHRLIIDGIRERELTRLHGRAYLDHGGSALYSKRQVEAAAVELRSTVMLNPHRYLHHG